MNDLVRGVCARKVARSWRHVQCEAQAQEWSGGQTRGVLAQMHAWPCKHLPNIHTIHPAFWLPLQLPDIATAHVCHHSAYSHYWHAHLTHSSYSVAISCATSSHFSCSSPAQ